MPLSPIGDIGTATLSEGVATGTLTWETASDWDNAASEAGVVHEDDANRDNMGSSTIRLGYPSFDRGGSALFRYYPMDDAGGSTAYDAANGQNGSHNSVTANDGLHGTDHATYNGNGYTTFPGGVDMTTGFTVFAWVYFQTNSNTQYITMWGQGGPDDRLEIRWKGSNSRLDAFWWNGSNTRGRVSGGSLTDGTFASVAVTFDGTDAWALYVDGTQVDTATDSYTATAGDNVNAIGSRGSSPPDLPWGGSIEDIRYYTRGLSSTEIQALHDTGTGGNVETATKSFAAPNKPDLQNLSYSLNTQSITIDVIGSPGTASEEIVSQTLDGSTSYSLTWSNSHTDFRVKPILSTTDLTTTPTVGRVELA